MEVKVPLDEGSQRGTYNVKSAIASMKVGSESGNSNWSLPRPIHNLQHHAVDRTDSSSTLRIVIHSSATHTLNSY